MWVSSRAPTPATLAAMTLEKVITCSSPPHRSNIRRWSWIACSIPWDACLTRRSAQALLNLQAGSDLQAHIEDLARKSTAGKLTAEERSEYEALVAAGTVIAILKAKARVLLAK